MAASAHAPDTTEVEFKLEVVGDQPSATLGDVERLDHLLGHRLGPPSRHLIHDRYWDTPDLALKARGYKVRLRELDGESLFTVKRGRRKVDGLFTCQELEVPATRDGWRAVVETLACLGLATHQADDDPADPAERLAALGLRVVQDRTTKRIVRRVGGQDGPAVELTLDTTRYHFGDRTAEYHEIEVEQLGGAPDTVRALGEALLREFPDRLRPAKKGKFGRGLALSRN